MIHSIPGAEYLPTNYKFELEKTIRQIKRRESKRIALQFPEGIIHLSTIISDILKCNTEVQSIVILSDVVYGACCIDDISTYLINCDLLIHYGHSCLFEVPKCLVSVMYVFVEVSIDVSHCIAMAQKYIDCTDVSVLGTIQYGSAVRKVTRGLYRGSVSSTSTSTSTSTTPPTLPTLPRTYPLSPGEVLGCTSPKVKTLNILFIAEGRFHLESTMIHNPYLNYFRYCPSSKKLLIEKHNYNEFLKIRKSKQKESFICSKFIVVFGTLGRQGGTLILQRVTLLMKSKGTPFTVVYLSELDEEFMGQVPNGTAVVEIACPRIAIDWGSTFACPILTPFEYFRGVDSMGGVEGSTSDTRSEGSGTSTSDTSNTSGTEYPMDYYTKEGDKQPWHMLQ